MQSPWPGYSPFINSDTQLIDFVRDLDFGTAVTSHHMLANVNEFTYEANLNYTTVSLDAGATLIASDNFGVPLLAINATGNVSGINVFPKPTPRPKSPGVYTTIANACHVEQDIVVDIDIKPYSDPNSVNLCSQGAVPVAVLGSETLNVHDINTDTLSLADAGVKMVGKKDKQLCSIEDVNGDGYDDLVCHFVTIDLASLDGASTTAQLSGNLLDSTPFTGSDSVSWSHLYAVKYS